MEDSRLGWKSRLKPAAAKIGRPTKRRSRNQNGCAARSADKNVGVAGLEARSTRKNRRCRSSLAPFRGSLCLSRIPSADARAIFFRPSDFGREKIVAACEEDKA